MKPKTKFPPTGRGSSLSLRERPSRANGNQHIRARARCRAARSAPTRATELCRLLGGGVGTTAKEADAGKALINFSKAPATVPVLKAKGMETYHSVMASGPLGDGVHAVVRTRQEPRG